MKMKYCLMGILLPFMNSFAQDLSKIKPLSVGDAIPGLVFTHIADNSFVNSPKSSLKDKLLIIDFMATTCKSCIAALPRFDSLQTLYGDKMQIILVTYEEEERVKTFLQNNGIGKTLKLPIVVKDTLLSKMFAHAYIPHEVWLQDGKVKAITNEQYVNGENIEAVLAGEQIRWPIKRDVTEYNYAKHLLQLNEENIPIGSFPKDVFYTAFSTSMIDVPHRYSLQKDTLRGAVKVSMINLPAIGLYVSSYNLYRYPKGQTLIEAKDKSRYIYDKEKSYRNEWDLENTYCFETVLPAHVPQNIRQQKIRNELDLYLGLYGRIEKRRVSSLILVRTDTTKLFITGKEAKTASVGMRTLPVSNLIYILNDNFYGTPAIDETGFTKTTLVTVDAKLFTNISLLRKALKSYSIDLITAEREIDMLVISEKTKNQ
jgi:thiol-disulfide isomerase/thioredoxin